jgi:hypothetical protein
MITMIVAVAVVAAVDYSTTNKSALPYCNSLSAAAGSGSIIIIIIVIFFSKITTTKSRQYNTL